MSQAKAQYILDNEDFMPWYDVEKAREVLGEVNQAYYNMDAIAEKWGV